MRALGAGLLLCAASILSGCAQPGVSYAGIPLAAGAADREIQSLARRAQWGDKRAQLELGIRYEEGRGLPVDLKRARKLYRHASSTSGGTVHVYSPPAGRGTSGRVTPVNLGPRRKGLPEAQARLERLMEKSK